MLLTKQQKQLILNILEKEQRKIISKYKGPLLNKTIDDLTQNLRNEIVNDPSFTDDKGKKDKILL